MNAKLTALTLALAALIPATASAEPLRVFIRAGEKSHGPGAHDFPQFLKEWVPMLNERGAKAEGGLEFPTKEQLDRTDVLILHAQEAGNIKIGEERKNLMEFLQRGGGLVVIHAAAVSRDHDWYKNIIGGSWKFGQTQWLEAPMSLYFTDRDNPITRDISNFDLDDEIYYDMEILPEVRVLAAAYTPKAIDTGGKGNQEAQARAAEAVAKKKGVNIYDIQPQVWTYEKDNYRAFTCIPGHWHKNFSHNGLRTLILRGIAWAGKRDDVDEFCKPEELGDALRYVEGGAPRPQDVPSYLEVHPEFEISLVAAEPLINNPMNIDWDKKGRLWVVESPEYPNGLRQVNVEPWMDSGSLMPGQYDREPQDRVSILEDTNGDGIMDKKTVFADKIELATSSVFYKNGVIVCAAPDIWFFEDTNGDGTADVRTRLYTNLGIRDTHAVINNMRWGLDGWIYATHGYSSSDNVTSGDGSKSFVLIGSGVVRFKPDGSAFEQYSSKGGNTWGLDITTDGQVFFTQPTSGVLFHHVVLPEYVLAKGKLPGVTSSNGLLPREPTFPAMQWEQQAYVQIDQVGSYTAAAGCAIYEGGAWPEKWHYGYFTTEPTLNIVSHFMVEPDGVTYQARREPGREQTEFIRSTNLWFRPIEVRVGPDGALYVVDFCNQAIIHNDTRGPTHGPANAAVRPDRDHYYGRIWRVQHKNARPAPATAYRHRPEAAGSMGSSALRAYETVSQGGGEPDGRNQLLEKFTAAQDDWTRSALVAAASAAPADFINAALASSSPDSLASFVGALVPAALPGDAERLIAICASGDATADSLKVAILRGIAEGMSEPPTLSAETTNALKKLLAQPSLSAAALPLATRWDKGGALGDEVREQLNQLTATLGDNTASVETRIEAARALIAVGGASTEVGVQPLGAQDTPEALSTAIIAALDESGATGALVGFFERLKPVHQQAAFEAILKRPDAVRALLDAVRDAAIDRSAFAPGDVARLRNHPNRALALRATNLFKVDTSAKDAIIAALLPEVEKEGDAEKGKLYFTAACAVCHKLGDLGVAVGPPLDGMGAHGPAELLIHIIDPNREVDPSFWAFNITTTRNEVLQGVITGENASTVMLATQTGPREIAKSDIAKRENTERSLMPEGLEALGAEALRDLLTFMCGDDSRQFRILPLTDAFTADSRDGVFAGRRPDQGRVKLAKFGNLTVEGIPFFVQDPERGLPANLVVLKGGPSQDMHSQGFPQRVEVPVNVRAKRLHLLSGISGWGYPAIQEEAPALRVVALYEDGQREVFQLVNGKHFSDYIRKVEVPGSLYVEGLTEGQQMRLLTLELTHPVAVKTLVLESPVGNKTVPVIAAITADIEGKLGHEPVKGTSGAAAAAGAKGKGKGKGKGKAVAPVVTGPSEEQPKTGGPNDAPMPPVKPVVWEPGKTRVLVISGGSSHDFATYFGTTDVDTLREAGFSVHYTEDRDQAAAELAGADAAVISVNRKFFDTTAYRKALMDFAAAGKGIVMLHPGTWYGYQNWPELNAQIVGGGARGHDKIHPFEVRKVADHPVMEGVPDSFTIEDELYYMNAEPENIPPGTAVIEVLAETSPSDKYQKPHPAVWITKHPSARIVCITPGHDARTHEHEAFKRLLSNAAKWAAGK
jgi:putative membrane-bound dehydrogenase-like protein